MKAEAVRHILSLAWYGIVVGLAQENFYKVPLSVFDGDLFSDAEILDWAEKIFSGQLVLDYCIVDMTVGPCLR